MAEEERRTVTGPRVGLVGLGAMGLGMARSLRRAGLRPAVHDIRAEAAERFAAEGGEGGEAYATAGELAAAAEAMALGVKAGVPPETLYEVITHSAGNSWLFDNRMAHALACDYTPRSAVDIFVKDLGIVLDTARPQRVPLPLAATAHQMFLQAAAGLGGEDDSAVIKIFPGVGLPDPAGEDTGPNGGA